MCIRYLLLCNKLSKTYCLNSHCFYESVIWLSDSGPGSLVRLQSYVGWCYNHPKASVGLEDPLTWLASWCCLSVSELYSHGVLHRAT